MILSTVCCLLFLEMAQVYVATRYLRLAMGTEPVVIVILDCITLLWILRIFLDMFDILEPCC